MKAGALSLIMFHYFFVLELVAGLKLPVQLT